MDLNFDFKVGQVVKSLKGRDKGEVMIIVEVISSSLGKIANGSNRPLSKPKLKKSKHLQIYNDVLKDFSLNPLSFNDSNLRKLLKSYIQDNVEKGCYRSWRNCYWSYAEYYIQG